MGDGDALRGQKFFSSIPLDSLPYFNSEVEVGRSFTSPKSIKEERQKPSKSWSPSGNASSMGKILPNWLPSILEDGSARAGGDLGWTKRGKYVPEFEAAAFKLERRNLSVVESEFGFHLIRCWNAGRLIHVRHILIKPELTDADLEKAKAHLDSVRHLLTRIPSPSPRR